VTERQFYDWQTAGGGGDVLLLIETLEREQVSWCAIGGLAVNYWAEEPIATADVDLAIAPADIERSVSALEAKGFRSSTFDGSINLQGKSKVSIQISTDVIYYDFPSRSVAADVHGILMRVASLEDTLAGKILAFQDTTRRGSKRQKDLLDITRLVEAHPRLSERLPADIAARIESSTGT
jgi:hypothetical protein